jgi:prevent-host-death family protein
VKVIAIQNAKLEDCIEDAQNERVIITRNGKPVAMVVGVEGMDREQLALSQSAKFWALIRERRKQPTITRAELEKRLAKEQ